MQLFNENIQPAPLPHAQSHTCALGADFVGPEGLKSPIFWPQSSPSHKPLISGMQKSDNCLFHAFWCPRMHFIVLQKKTKHYEWLGLCTLLQAPLNKLTTTLPRPIGWLGGSLSLHRLHPPGLLDQSGWAPSIFSTVDAYGAHTHTTLGLKKMRQLEMV